METTLIKYNKTAEQNSKLMFLALSEWTTKLKSRPTLTNNNLLVKITDEKGREEFRELTPQGNLKFTNLYF